MRRSGELLLEAHQIAAFLEGVTPSSYSTIQHTRDLVSSKRPRRTLAGEIIPPANLNSTEVESWRRQRDYDDRVVTEHSVPGLHSPTHSHMPGFSNFKERFRNGDAASAGPALACKWPLRSSFQRSPHRSHPWAACQGIFTPFLQGRSSLRSHRCGLMARSGSPLGRGEGTTTFGRFKGLSREILRTLLGRLRAMLVGSHRYRDAIGLESI